MQRCVVAVIVLWSASARALPEAQLGAPTPRAGWEQWQVRDAATVVNVLVARDDRPLPLVVFATGSHCLPVFFFSGDGSARKEQGVLPFDVDAARARAAFHFAVVERKNLHSFSTIANVRESDRCTEERGGVRKEERAADLAAAALALRDKPWVSKLLLAGHSEGAEVATGALRMLDPGTVAAVGFFSSGGISQFFDLTLVGRRSGDAAASQKVFDELLAITGPTPPTDYEGFPVERFRTFAIESTALDDLATTTTPIFVARGTRDRNSAPENTDATVVELLRRNRQRAIHYLILDGLDHRFEDAYGVAHADDVLVRFVAWGSSPAMTRDVETVSYPVRRPSASAPSVRFLGMPPWLIAALCLASAAMMRLSRTAAPRVRKVLLATSTTLFVLGGATVGLWWGVVAGFGESLPHALSGILAGTLASVLWRRRR